jgi:hypothetical protein
MVAPNEAHRARKAAPRYPARRTRRASGRARRRAGSVARPPPDPEPDPDDGSDPNARHSRAIVPTARRGRGGPR